jgi:flagellar basal-body rod modification protein FlgD
LLVTEMQNQDPTADTDPNEYINQLVNVNSLEQLIDINQTLTTDLGSTATSAGGTTPAGQVAASTSSLTGKTASGASPQVQAGQLAAAPSAVSSSGAASASQALAARPKHAPGNLSVPDATPAALRVAQSLSGRTHAQSIASRLPGAQ